MLAIGSGPPSAHPRPMRNAHRPLAGPPTPRHPALSRAVCRQAATLFLPEPPATPAKTEHFLRVALAHLKTPISVIVQVLSALTEGVGINAATRLYGVSKNSIYRWQERLSGVKKKRAGKRLKSIQVPAFQVGEQELSFFFARALRMILRRWRAST